MAQLELANLAPATAGPATKSIGMGAPAETGEGAMPTVFSFCLLLQGNVPENLVATVSGELAPANAGSLALDPQAGRPGLERADPADPAAAGEQSLVAALAGGLASDAGEADAGEAGDGATETGPDGAKIGAAESPPVQADWLGLPLVMDARAALRNVDSSDIAAPASTVAADATRLRWLSGAASATGQPTNGDGSVPPVGDSVARALGDAALASTAIGRQARRGDKSLPQNGDPGAQSFGAGTLTATAVGVAAAIEAPRPASGSTAGIAGADLAEAFDGSSANVVEKLLNQAAGSADPIRSPPAGSAVAEAEVKAGQAIAGGQAGASVRLSDASHPAPATVIGGESTPASAALARVHGERQPALSAGAHPLQWHPRLAESLSRIGAELAATNQSALAGNAGTSDETAPVATAAKSDQDAGRPLPPAIQNLASLLAADPANGRPAGAVAALAPADEIAREAAAIRVAEPAGPADIGALARSGSPSAAPVRPEAPTASVALPTTPDTLNLNQKNWERTLGHQLNWMVNNRLQEAEIKVNPPDLGPLEVRVSQHQHQTSVTFFSHEAAVREALETALPRLREMLDSQGISLNQAQVSDQSLARQQAGAGEQSAYGRRDGGSTADTAGREAAPSGEEAPRPRTRELRGAVDDYA